MTQGQRKRPKDRREQIARAAAEDFSRRGYQGVGIEQIAATLDISGPAVYRHFPNKYALLEHAITNASDALCTAVADAATASADLDVESRIAAILSAALGVSFERRNTGGLFRWEQRLLQRDDRLRIRHQLNDMIATFRDAAAPAVPDVDPDELWLRCIAAISVMGSITAHRTVLAHKRAESVLLAAGTALLHLPAPPVPYRSPEVEQSVAEPVPAGAEPDRAAQVLEAAIDLIFERGFHDVSMSHISEAVGIVPSGMYRYFPNKAGILVGALDQAANETIAVIERIRGDVSDPVARLAGFAQGYVDLAFRMSKLMTVYFREIGNVPDVERRRLAALQRSNVAAFADAVVGVRPELSTAEATFLVHAAFAVVFDAGRTRKFDTDIGFQQEIYTMVCAVFFSS